jgi:hypothetical protein
VSDIDVRATASGDGWACTVTLRDGRETRHLVSVSRATLGWLDPGASDPSRLVRASFEFLLERESRESILREFDLMVIGRYFPEYEGEIRRRLAR